MTSGAERIVVENVNHPGQLSKVDAAKYRAMRAAFLKVLPESAPGVTQKEFLDLILPHLPDDLFPAGKTSGWWAKTVQLDLEAKKLVVREHSKPLRWHR